LVCIALPYFLCACTVMVPKEKLPFPLATEDSNDQVKTVTIPLPVIASSPDEGITGGALSAFLLHNKRDEVTSLMATQVNHNRYFGVTTSLYGAFFPSAKQSWEVNLSKSTTINEDYEIRVNDASFREGNLEINASLFDFSDGSSRFFGFQQCSAKNNETNYTDSEKGFNVSGMFRVSPHFQLLAGERLRNVSIERGAVRSVPFTGDVFTASRVPGLDGFTTHAQRVSLIYSTLDTPTLPSFGGYARATVECSSRLLGSSADFRHYEVEMKGYIPLDNARYINVFRLQYNQSLGSRVPFLERSSLGGETTLRGYGRNRFIDSSSLLCNLEERIRLFRWEVFDVTADWELAPFIDFGAVMKSLDKADTRSFEFNPGLGARAVVRPNIVGRVDVGLGKEGPAVFVGLGYPF